MRGDYFTGIFIDRFPELLNMQNAFHQGQYNDVIDFDTTSLSAQNKLSARILVLRAKLALGQAEEVLDETDGEDDEPDLKAVRALAQYVTGDVSTAVEAVEQLTASSSENPTVQILGGIVLQGAGKSEGALSLLAKHEANLEAYDFPIPMVLLTSTHTYTKLTDLLSQSWSDCADSSSTKSHGSGSERGSSCKAMGPR